MKSNTELILDSIKLNLTGNIQNDIEYLNSIAVKHSENQELTNGIESIKSLIIKNEFNDFTIATEKQADTSIEDGIIQEKEKKPKTKADKQIQNIKTLFKKSTIDAELMLVCCELPKLQSLYEKTTLVSEKEAICKFANYNFNGLTPLHLACYYEDFELVKFFISIGADINARFGIYEVTPLDHLLYNNKSNIDSNNENRRKIEMYLINCGAKKGFSLKRNLGLIILTGPSAAAFLVASIFNPLFLIISAVFILLTILLTADCRMYKSKSKKTAVILAVLGGGLGLHKFYLNNLPAAFKHLLLSIITLFIGGIVLGCADVSRINNGSLLDAGILGLKK